MGFEIVIGLEIHCELATKSKIFCGCPTTFGASENENVCPVCMGLPGTLPVLNEKVVEYAVKAGLALNCAINKESVMDRKNYFYPDLPKAYQISQFHKPLCEFGFVAVNDAGGDEKKIGITRIHIEEDAGKLVHAGGATLLDNNRCGVPLIEIVSEPDMRSAAEAESYAKKVKTALQTAGVSDCKMQEGSIRFDVNISVRPEGEPTLGTRTEIKNLNSFRALVRAVEYESKRQIAVVSDGGKIYQDTLRWDDAKNKTISMRTKENAHDYRYFPDPDLVPVVLTDAYVENCARELPELPESKKRRYVTDYGLAEKDAALLTEDAALSDLFEQAFMAGGNAKLCANFILVDVLALAKNAEEDFGGLCLTGGALASIAKLADSGAINMATAKKVLAKTAETGQDPGEIVRTENLMQISDDAQIRKIVREVMEKNPQCVRDLKDGKGKAVSFIVGQVMREMKGKANPAVVNAMINELLKEM
jgi:aspartyl-tRNA(Asn)/glutamyl-tRNA(Gln) amidotransferase subunit B